MPKIRILPEFLANRIAAGEIVERPASAVKELVENALDAGARRILVEIEGGGQRLIRVVDDGEGMDRQDILLSLERHATSKILDENDLFNIRTLGFRGEALPSIASVSKMTLISRKEEDLSGHRVRVDYGRAKEVVETGCPKGTSVEVAGLFANLPARRKFLKSYATEVGHIQDCVESIALTDCDVQFILKNEGRFLLSTASGERVEDRLKSILRLDRTAKLLPLTGVSDGIGISGYVGRSEINRASLHSLYIFVNKRFVRDRIVRNAVFDAFKSFLMRDRYPAGLICIELPSADVDVNVHPTKSEIRFRDPQHIYRTVGETVRKAILSDQQVTRPEPFSEAESIEIAPDRGPQSEKSFHEPLQASMSLHEIVPPYVPLHQPAQMESAIGSTPPEWRLAGQLAESYILCESVQGLVVIDQHAAHERVLFEQLRGSFKKGGIESQQLVFPEALEVPKAEAEILSQHTQSLFELGIDITPFGGETFLLRAIPAVLPGRDARSLVESVITHITTSGDLFAGERLTNEIIALMACHGAIKAHQALTAEEMESLLRQLFECPVNSNCPHGRPIWQLYSLYEIEKGFKRK
ncbi:MAG: DNA mismatch repair endonuclease MutL [Pseudomonadota bacterium]